MSFPELCPPLEIKASFLTPEEVDSNQKAFVASL